MRALVPFVLSALLAGPAAGQTLRPMEGRVVTFAERAAVRAFVTNPYAMPRRFTVNAFDASWQPIKEARFPRSDFILGAGGERSILAIIPSPDEEGEPIYICATAEPLKARGAAVKGRVCGRFRILRRSL
ncbi:hypothetical protein HK107_14855 [Parvularcula sp. ZS-1/3]|uniref:Uncharacterized protein n=1 Tax=Parvularcula mediterranea TaxID=2732508 RepID=A0A7Y3RNZ0_9PROT|nr:hypothetical protein [Parvularcula mediterranea]NNU17609.1 hypothetical protein [Parvularcula mediterranea]